MNKIDIWDPESVNVALALTKEKMDEVCGYAASGASQKDVAWAAGLQPALLQRWLAEGRKLQDAAYKEERMNETKSERVRNKLERYYELYIGYEQARARERIRVLERIKAAGPHFTTEHSHKIVGQWQAAEAWLVRTSDEYLDRDRLAASKNNAVNVNISLDQIRRDLDKLEEAPPERVLNEGEYEIIEPKQIQESIEDS